MRKCFSICSAARALRSRTRVRCFQIRRDRSRLEPHSEGLRERIWWGAGSNATAVWAAKIGMNLQSSTLKNDETGEPFHVQQAKQIRAYRDAWKEAGDSPQLPRLGQPQHFRAGRRPRPRLFRRRTGRRPYRFHRSDNARDLRPQLCRRAAGTDRTAQAGRRDCGSGHAATHRPQPIRRRLQHARD